MDDNHKKCICELVFKESLDPVILADPLTFKIVQSNKAAADVIGMPDLVGQNMFSLVSSTMREELIASLKDHMIKSGARELRVDVQTVSGTIVPTMATTYFVDFQGKRYFVAIFHQMEGLKKVENEIRETALRFDIVSAISGQVIYDYNVATGKIDWSGAIFDVTGYTPEEFSDFTLNLWEKAIHPEDRVHATQELAKALREHTKYFVHYRFKKKEGNYIYIQDEGMFLTKNRMLGTMKDVTEAKKAEEAVRESQEKFRILYESSSDAIMTLDPENGRFTAANPATLRMFKIKNEAQFIKLSPWDISPEHQPDGQKSLVKAEAMIGRALQKGSNLFEWVHKRYQGEPFSATVLLTRIVITGKTLIQATVRDISEEKKNEELRRNEERFRSIFKSSSDGMVLADPRTRRFHMANKAWCKMLGYRENEVTKLGLADVHPKQSLSFVIKQFDLLVRKKIGIAKEIPVIRKDGRLLYADITTGNMQLENKFYMLETFRDVTERKLATDALKSSRSQLKNLSDSIGGAMIYQIYAADAKSREITYISNRCREFYGASPEQIMKNPQLMYGKVYPEDVEKLVKGEAQALAKAKQLKIELRMLNPDGSIRWSYFISTPHKLGNGITLWDGIEFDITERKKIEEKLGESEERFRSLVSATSQIIWRTNPKGEMHIEQPDWARFTGQSKKEYMGSGWGKAIHPDDLERVAKVWANAVKTRSVVSAEYRLRKANGQYAYIISRGVPVLNKDGSVREWIGTINDITARKETENALRESEERFRRIFEEGQIGVSMLGLDGHFLRANQKLCQILGYSEKELNRLRFADITHPEERARDAAKPIELVEGKISHYDVEKRYIRKDGKIIWCAIHVSMVRDQNGKPLYFITITDDITKRKENEIELKKTSEIVKNSIEPMSLVDFGKTNLLKYVNPAWEKLFGYKRSEVVNRKQSLLLETIRGQADLNQEFTKLIKNKKPFIRELILKKKNGEQIYAEVFVQPIFDERGQLLIWANNIRDITVRKRIEIELERYRHHLEDLVKRRTAELSRQTTFLDSIVENIPNMIFVKDAKELRFERFNKAGEKLLGMKRKNLYGKNDYDFFPKAQADFFTSKDRAVLKSKKLFDISEEPIDTKHGKRFLHTKKIPILDKDGKPVYLLGISEDITEQKEARQKLIEAEHKAQEYLDIAPAITVALDRNGRVTTISSVGAALLGYPKGKIIGKPWFDTFVPASIQENVKKVFRQLMLGNVEPVRHYENPIVIYGGKQRLIEWYNTLLRDNKGHIVGTLSSGQDITEKKKTELELAESEKFLGSVLENVPYLVFVKRTPDFRWVMANKAMSEFMQLPKEKILGKTNYQLFPKEQAEFFQSKDQESIASLSIVHIDEEVIRTSSGDKLIRLSKIPIVGEKGEVKYVMGIGEDITESKDVEMMKARFISSVSHELRTPITPIRAQTQRMLDKELPPEEKKEGLEIILRNTIRLDRLIQDILEINRIRAGRLQVYFKKEDLNSIVQTVLTDMESLIKVKDTKIYFSPGKLPKLMVDKDRIMEIVINLVDNAIKYGHKKIWIKTELKGREVLVSVKDNGIGISQEHLKMVFIPFFRAQEPGTSGVEGTGLGLSIAKGIVESHKGRIWMQSKKGKGTTVYFALPVKFK